MKQNTNSQRPTDFEKADKNFDDDAINLNIDVATNIARIVDDNMGCDEIKLQLQDHKVKRLITTETISAQENPNIERICRQFANQDVLIKIRNGKKISIERTKIIRSH